MGKKPAFTMVEMLFVIVVLSLLASFIVPRMQRDIRQEAADNIISAIRLTQQMALMDNVERPGEDKWQRAFWRFGKSGCSDDGIFYFIGSDKNLKGGIGENEAAMELSTQDWMLGKRTEKCESDLSEQTFSSNHRASKNIFLTKLYGIKDGNMLFSSACSTSNGSTEQSGYTGQIAFDYLGRPHSSITTSILPNYATLLREDCNITLSFAQENIQSVTITVEKETGRVYQAN